MLRRVVRLLSHCSVLEASNEASLRQAQSASDQCKRLMDENEELKKVICKLKSRGKKNDVIRIAQVLVTQQCSPWPTNNNRNKHYFEMNMVNKNPNYWLETNQLAIYKCG